MSPKITKDHEMSEIISDKMSPRTMKMRSPKITKNFSFNMMTFHDIWWFWVTFDDYWWFFMTKSGDLSWLIMIHHDWSWKVTIHLEEVSTKSHLSKSAVSSYRQSRHWPILAKMRYRPSLTLTIFYGRPFLWQAENSSDKSTFSISHHFWIPYSTVVPCHFFHSWQCFICLFLTMDQTWRPSYIHPYV